MTVTFAKRQSLVDGGTLTSYLQAVATWVNAHPTEGESSCESHPPSYIDTTVITLVIVNSDDLPPTSFSSAFQTAGLVSKMYSPPSATLSITQWPTLGSLVDAGTTVVAFMDQKADFTSVPWLIDEFSNMWEDPYSESGCS